MSAAICAQPSRWMNRFGLVSACWLACGWPAFAAAPATPTFNRDIAPILFAKCAACHRPGEVAPFPLLTFADAQKRAKQLATVTGRRLMPPWKAQPGHGVFLDERRLDDALIWVKDWDFNWQDNYVYRQPFTLPKGTQLRLEAWFDNSTNNPANPSQPPQPVVFGEQTTAEMAMCILEVTCDKLGDLLFLIGDDARHRQVIERALRLSP